MNSEPMIFPLDVEGRIYVLQDDRGHTIGTGSREVCEMLLYIIKKAGATTRADDFKPATPTPGAEIRSAIEF